MSLQTIEDIQYRICINRVWHRIYTISSIKWITNEFVPIPARILDGAASMMRSASSGGVAWRCSGHAPIVSVRISWDGWTDMRLPRLQARLQSRIEIRCQRLKKIKVSYQTNLLFFREAKNRSQKMLILEKICLRKI